ILNEKLSASQYIGFGAIVLCSAVLSFNGKSFRPNRALWLMGLVSVGLTVEAILYRYAFDHGVRWGTALTWSSLSEVLISMCVVIWSGTAADLKWPISDVKKKLTALLVCQIFTWAGAVAGLYALFLLPVSIVKGIDA